MTTPRPTTSSSAGSRPASSTEIFRHSPRQASSTVLVMYVLRSQGGLHPERLSPILLAPRVRCVPVAGDVTIHSPRTGAARPPAPPSPQRAALAIIVLLPPSGSFSPPPNGRH